MFPKQARDEEAVSEVFTKRGLSFTPSEQWLKSMMQAFGEYSLLVTSPCSSKASQSGG